MSDLPPGFGLYNDYGSGVYDNEEEEEKDCQGVTVYINGKKQPK